MSSRITPAEHLEGVQKSFDDSINPRLVDVMRVAVKHLHAFTAEVGLTHKEWFAGIDFLTQTGKMCDEVRQEFILLSDTLGVSMLLEMINYAASDGATEPTVFGPFHVDGAPNRKDGESIVDHILPTDSPLVFSGTVNDLSGKPIAGASLDVWQVQSNGLYDVQQGASQRNLRGIFKTNPDGTFTINTVRPIDYTIPDDGPVGKMLRASGRHQWRPAHIHMVVSADGFIPVITHLFDQASKYLDSDAVFGVRDSLIVDMSKGHCKYEFVLDSSVPKVH